jgi:hypothetical protein
LLFTRCAQIGVLTGGKKDKTPPQLISITPKDTSTNMPNKKLTITFLFDEMVDVKAVSQSLTINPCMDNKPEIIAGGKRMIVKFNDTLQRNTTYQLQFGNSVKDVHEGNKYRNLTYLFSTGSVIDSNTVSGTVTDAFTFKNMKDVSVMLFSDLSDTAVTRSKPDYLVKTDSLGMYSISAIKPDTYQIVAITDKNKSKTFDAGEAIGFRNTPLIITGKDTVDFKMSIPKSNNSFIKKKIQSFWGYHKYILSDTIPDAYIILLEDSSKTPERNADKDKIAYETRNDTLEVYYKDIYDTELKFMVKRNQTIIDTVKLEVPNQTKVDSTINKNGKKINMSVNKAIFGNKNDDIYVSFPFPIENTIDMDKCLLLHDDKTEKAILTAENKNENNNLVTTYLPAYKRRLLNKLLESKTYILMFLPNSITTYWGKTNADTIKTTFKTYSNDDIGTLKVKLTIPDSIHNYVIQLLNSKEKVLNEYSGQVKKENNITFYNLASAEYSFRFMNDVDANKKFTPANFSTHTQPEDVYIYTKLVKVPAGWDVETDWDITRTPSTSKE